MEKMADGHCEFRNARCEERIAKKFEEKIWRKREKIMFEVEKEIEKEETKSTRGNFNSLKNITQEVFAHFWHLAS